MNSEKILSLEDVCFSYKPQTKMVLQEFSMDVSKGHVVAVLGPNGTGKTTMIMLALGWLQPDSGNIFYQQKNIKSFSRRELGQRISLVPQSEPTFFDFSLLDFALLGRAPYLGNFSMPSEEDYQIAIEALKKVGMFEKADASVMNLSGGEQQLVLLARALAQQTDLVILDEPTSHLDIKNKSRLISILRELLKDGKTIIFTTHEPDVASMIADQVLMVKGGQVVFSGAIDETMTGANLSEIYQIKIETEQLRSRKIFLWE